MSLVDFLDPCPRCDGEWISGTGVNVKCPDCVGGLVVSEDDIEASAKAMHQQWVDRYDPTGAMVWDSMNLSDREWMIDQARAAVTTLIQQWRTK